MTQQINLYNPLFLKQEKHFSSRTMVHALTVVLLGIVVVFVAGSIQTRSAERLASQYREQVLRQRDQVVKLGGQVGSAARSKALEAETARLESEIKLRQATLQALATGELGNTAGFSEFFAALGREAMTGIWLTRIHIGDAGNDLVIEGRALRAELLPSYLRALSREAMMRGRRVTEMKLTAAGGTAGAAEPARFVEFSLTAPLELRGASSPGRSP
ncbi:MAG TPA: hypothetical protein VE935_15160 [Burkholderiales bacterium]|jgi:Tfp pilus assembly protein PilN|nr:hypothetical protein [Burkholderiales bacterium]